MLRRGVLLASLLAMTACAAAPENAPASLVDTSWALSASDADGLKAAGAASGVTLVFAADRVSGSGGCNRYQADYTLVGDTLTVGPVGATKMGCMDGRGEIERAWFAALGKPLTVARSGDSLVLKSADGVSHTLVATVADKP